MGSRARRALRIEGEVRRAGGERPALALASGPDGLEVTRRLLAEGRNLLTPGGWLVMELDSSRSSTVRDLAVAAGWTSVNVWDDLFGRPRYLTARRELPE